MASNATETVCVETDVEGEKYSGPENGNNA